MIDLIINPNSVRVSKSEISTQIFGEIYFQIGDSFFPEEKWDDFAVIILGWWLKEACNIRSKRVVQFLFMDGPFYFEVHLVNKTCNIKFIDDRYDKKRIVNSGKIERAHFFNLLKQNANLLINSLPDEANQLEDVMVIKNNLKIMQNQMKRILPPGNL